MRLVQWIVQQIEMSVLGLSLLSSIFLCSRLKQKMQAFDVECTFSFREDQNFILIDVTII